ncbi:MAG: hypothetical protein ACKVRN_12125 [Pyrinomonadaceae bacterium]
MSKINEKKDKTMLNREEKEFSKLFYEALKIHGLGIPTTIAEVQDAETEGLETDFSDLPTWMQDPAEVLRRSKEFSLKLVPLAPKEEPCQDRQFARAARLGREIPKDVEDRMRKDRAAAKDRSGT